MTEETDPTTAGLSDDEVTEERDDEDTSEHDTFVVSQSAVDTDELPLVKDEIDDDALAESSDSGVRGGRTTTVLLGVVAVLLILSLAATAWMFTRVQATEDELATTQEDLARVESGAALYASQINGFVETIDELGPSIDEGLDQAIAGLEEFGTTTIEFDVPIDTSIPIDEEVETTITIDGPFGIDVPLDITVPVNVDVPVDLDVPISIQVEGTELEGLTSSLIEGLNAFRDGLGGLTNN